MNETPLNVPGRTEAASALAHGPFEMPRVIVTERLMLCPIEKTHHAAYARMASDEAAMRFLTGTVDDLGAFFHLCRYAGQWGVFGFGHYAICDQHGQFLGSVGLYLPIDWPEVEIAYFLAPWAQGRGYASEAVRAVRDAAASRGAPTLVSYIDPDNAPSIALAERVGAQLDGQITLLGREARVYRYPMPTLAAPDPADEIPYLETKVMPRRIDTQRITLRAWEAAHFEDYAKLMADPQTMRFIGGVGDRTDAWRAMMAGAGAWQLHGFGTYAIEWQGTFAGFCGLFFPFDWPEIELAYALAPHGRGQGLATEAAQTVLAVAAEQGVNTLVSYIDPDNAASLKVAARLGAEREGDVVLRGGTVAVLRSPIAQSHARAVPRAPLMA